MTFKVGDKVRCIESGVIGLTLGKIYTISRIIDSDYPYVIDDDGDDNWFCKRRFELVQEDKLPHELLGLDRYRVVKKDESDPLWDLFWSWYIEQCGESTERNAIYLYYGYDDRETYTNGFDFFDDLEDFKNNPTIITLAERDRIVNKKLSQTKKLSKPIRSCEHNGSIYKEDTIDGISIGEMKATRDNINSKLLTWGNLFSNPNKKSNG